MPAPSGDPVAAALQHSLTTSKNLKGSSLPFLATSHKSVLSLEVKYEPICSFNTTQLDDLKSKYTILSTTSPPPPPGSPVKPPVAKVPTASSSVTHSPSPTVNTPEHVPHSGPSLPTPKRIFYPPESVVVGFKSKVPVGVGFINLGNTCYLNSTLQALFHVPAFVNWLTSDSAHFNKCQTINGMTHSECLICAMSKVLQQTHNSSGPIKPVCIYSKLKSICKHLVHGQQEDAHEFLRYLMEGMERSYLTVFNGIKLDSWSKETTPLSQIFGGYLRTEVTCLECRYVSTTFQHFQDILLDIRTASSVEEALDGYFSRERLGEGEQAYRCEQCQKRVAAAKKFSIERPPKALCLQLKRFGAMGGKNNKHISLKQVLDMTKYRHRPQVGSHLRYKLVSLVTHLGQSASCGHYTAVGQSYSGSYHLFDDSIVRPLSIQNVLNSNAYILMYELESSGSSLHSNGSLKTSQRNENGETSNGINGNVKRMIPITLKTGTDRTTLVKTAPIVTSASPSVPPSPQPKPQPTSSYVTSSPVKPSISPVKATPPSPVRTPTSSPVRTVSPVTSPFPTKPATPPPPTISKNEVPSLVPYTGESSDSEEGEISKSSEIPSTTAQTNGSSEEGLPNKLGTWRVTPVEKSTEKPTQLSNGRSTYETLIKMNHSGYGSSVKSWDDDRSLVDKEVDAERHSHKRPRFDSNDDDMDRGKVKKIKVNGYRPKDRVNRFQDYQNQRNRSLGSRQNFFRQYTNDRSKHNCSRWH